MKIHSHTKKQIIAALIMVIIFALTVLYSKGYFDFTFIDRQSNLDFSSNNNQTEQTGENKDETVKKEENEEDFIVDDENYIYDEEYDNSFSDQDTTYDPEASAGIDINDLW